MKLIGYLRISTESQEDGLGLDVQRQAIERWAKQHRHQLVDVIPETASGTLEDRPGIGAAIRAVKDGQVEGVVVYRLDRLARDLIHQEQFLREIWQAGGQMFSTSAAEQENLRDDPDDPTRRLIRQVLGAVADFERSMIKLRLRNGRRAKAERGGYAWGRPPYGYQAVEGELVEVPEELEVIERMRAMKRKRMSLRAIADELNADAIPSPSKTTPWSQTAVQRVLQRAGVKTARKAKTVKTHKSQPGRA